jgi:hypothetical protein
MTEASEQEILDAFDNDGIVEMTRGGFAATLVWAAAHPDAARRVAATLRGIEKDDDQ